MLFSDIKAYVKDRRYNGKRACFQWRDAALDQYIKWAFGGDNLFCVLGENGIYGLGIAYALPKSFDGNIQTLLPSDEPVEPEDTKELVVMDWIADSPEHRKVLVSQFKKRFKNWENQTKWGVHYGKVRKLSNNFINKLETL